MLPIIAAVGGAIVAAALMAYMTKDRPLTLALADDEGAISTQTALITGGLAIIAVVVLTIMFQQARNTACAVDTDFTAIQTSVQNANGTVGDTGPGSNDECT